MDGVINKMMSKSLIELKDKLEDNSFKNAQIKALLDSINDSWEDVTQLAWNDDEEKRNLTWYEVDRVSERINIFLYLTIGMLEDIKSADEEVMKGLLALANDKEGDC